MVFYLAAGINIGSNLFYVMFASAKEQSWSRSQRLSTINWQALYLAMLVDS